MISYHKIVLVSIKRRSFFHKHHGTLEWETVEFFRKKVYTVDKKEEEVCP